MTTTTTKPTIVDSFLKHVTERPNDRFMTQPMGKGQECRYWTYAETVREAKQIAHYLQSNFAKGDKIAICSKNCSWWILADLAIMMSGMVSVPVYPTLTHETVAYILEHSESKALFIGKLDEHPWSEMKAGVPENLTTISFPLWPQNYKTKEMWDGLLQRYEPIETIVPRDPDELATIIYTSGSTGTPKGVMHNFHALLVTTEGITKRITAGPKDRYVSYLPLAHGMERWLGECVALYAGVQLFFAESIDTFVQDLLRARPTLFLSVPRLWTKFQAGVYKKLPPHKLNTLLKIPILSFFIRKKVLKGLGLDQVRVAGSGSAPIPAELITWYRSLGLELLEGYGMTENFNYSHLSLPGKCRPGYVGHAYDDVQVRIAEDGEIQVKSPGQMVGYYKNQEATKEAFTDDGWLRTGDRGEIDEDGRLKITGRTKELFKTSKGKQRRTREFRSRV
jgi:long-chain acyl-CoA synthetase